MSRDEKSIKKSFIPQRNIIFADGKITHFSLYFLLLFIDHTSDTNFSTVYWVNTNFVICRLKVLFDIMRIMMLYLS
jgi:hypothetical protein